MTQKIGKEKLTKCQSENAWFDANSNIITFNKQLGMAGFFGKAVDPQNDGEVAFNMSCIPKGEILVYIRY